MSSFGAQLRQLRLTAHLTQAELGKDSVTPQAISVYENDRARPTRVTVERLADKLGPELGPQLLEAFITTSEELAEREEQQTYERVYASLETLQAAHPHWDLLTRQFAQPDDDDEWGSWCVVVFVDRDAPRFSSYEFAIWKRTGAIHTVKDGAVSDDPLVL